MSNQEKNKEQEFRPTVSFQWKIGIAICLLVVSLTSFGFYLFYAESYKVIFGLLQKNLRDVGSVGALVIDEECREAIKRLKKRALEEAVFDREIIGALPVGGTTKTIPPERVKELHASEDFKMLLRRLQMISYASYQDVFSLQEKDHDVGPSRFADGMISTYIGVDLFGTLPDDFGMYLVSTNPEPKEGGWAGNPIGNVTRVFKSFSSLYDEIFINDDVIEDDYYRSLSIAIPIYDKNTVPVAMFGLDYAVGSQLDKLDRMKTICLVLIIMSLFLSLLLSFFISKSLSAPLYKLCNAAKKVSERDYSAKVDIRNKDEFGLLAQVFNQMLASIKSSFKRLDDMNKNLEKIVDARTMALKEVNVELSSNNEMLELLSTTDQLTGIFNRRYMEEQILVAIERSERYGEDMSLVMVDIDYFKGVNDTYGHDIGDKVLAKIALTLINNVRGIDIVGRWGGEEFLILFQANEYGARSNADKLRLEIMSDDYGIPDKITASFGYTQNIKGDTLDSWVKRADQALYKAKENGRNRVEAGGVERFQEYCV